MQEGVHLNIDGRWVRGGGGYAHSRGKEAMEVQIQKSKQGTPLEGSPRDDGAGQVPRGCGGHEPGLICSSLQSAHTLHKRKQRPIAGWSLTSAFRLTPCAAPP
jgi:hypothetical protein